MLRLRSPPMDCCSGKPGPGLQRRFSPFRAPPASPIWCFAGFHQALIYAWLGTLGAEYLLEPAPGVGSLMVDGRERFAMDVVLVGLIVSGLVGFGLNVLATAAEDRLLRWRVRGV